MAKTARKLSYPPTMDFVNLLFAANLGPFDMLLMISGTITAILGGMPFPILGLLYGKLVDDMASSCDEGPSSTTMGEATQRKVLGIFGVALANFTMIYAYNGLWALFGERLTYRIRFACMQALLKQEPAYFHVLPAGEIAGRLDTDMTTIQNGTAEKVAIYITSMSYFITAYAVSFYQDARLTWKMALLVPVYLAFAQYSAKYLERFTKIVDEGVQSATSFAAECLHNIPLVHAFLAADRFEELFRQRLREVARAVVKKTLTAASQLAFMSATVYISNALALWQGSRHIAAAIEAGEDGGFGRVYTVMACVLDASLVFAHISHFFTFFVAASTSYGNLLPVLRRKSKIDGTNPDDGVDLGAVLGDIELRNVTFRYPSRPETEVLRRVSLTIPAGKATAIVGLSGSGKSTISALINRVYDTSEGRLFLDGRDVREWNVHSLRRSIAFVEQEPTLMNCSVLENVAYGLVGRMEPWPAGSLEDVAERIRRGQSPQQAVQGSHLLIEVIRRVETALRQAQAHDFVSKLQHGIATAVGTRCGHLSGGERQRIALARALVRDAPILIMDEATSALDTATETAIQQSLRTAYEGRTVVMIAHRLSSIKHVDKVIVMSGGSVIEEGSYRDLLAAGGAFARLVELQALQHESKATAHRNMHGDGRADPSSQDGSLPGQGTSEMDSKSSATIEEHEDVVEPTEKKTPYARVLRQLREYTRPRRSLLFMGLAAATFIGTSHSIEAVMMGGAVDALTGCHPAMAILASGRRLGTYFLGMGALVFGANLASSCSMGSVAEHLLLKTRLLSLRSLLAQDVQWHEANGRTPSGLLSYLSADVTSLSNITGNLLGISLAVFVSLIMGPLLAHLIAWKMAVLLLLVLPIQIAAGVWRGSIITKFQQQHREAFDSSVRIATEAFDAINTIAAFGLEGEMLSSYRRSLHRPYDATLRLIGTGNFFLALGFAIPNALSGIAYWWGAKLILANALTPAQFFTVLPAMLVGAQGCGQLFTLVADAARATTAGARVFDLISLLPRSSQQQVGVKDLDRGWRTSHHNDQDLEAVPLKPLLEKHSLQTPQRTGAASITLQNIHFTYPSRPQTPVLKDLSLTIAPDQFAAIVGPSGSGKSTLFALLERFYRPTSGHIHINGQDITKSDSTSFRNTIALVPQTNMIFDASVGFNLNLGAVGRTAEIEDAARRANIHETITSLPEGYNTPCGAGGKSFSSGQRQRLSLARALVRRPGLLLLDEPTSALDSESERHWQATLEASRARGETTVVIIAHRLHTIQRADVIFCVEEGRVVDEGTHGELVGRNERYRGNVLAQAVG
ncbi:hypothetical protein PRZ48_008211 [Zasmidium cellare]|uniref:Uncharacterized protein n=1 Tax=Zasmidium cellare TaxID=395010 RepID=A0ABR0EFW0_ZASCE|nr:hypothetical protein PRZ48_008211 [Zasmidium cellare]